MLLLLQHLILAQAEEPAMVLELALEPAGTPVVVSALPILLGHALLGHAQETQTYGKKD